MGRRTLLGWCVASCALVGLISTDAVADVAAAKRLFKQAQVEFGAGEFEKALELYLQAYRKQPLPGFHFNIAQCHRNLGDLTKAVFHFKQYLASADPPRFAAEAEELIARSEQKLAEQARARQQKAARDREAAAVAVKRDRRVGSADQAPARDAQQWGSDDGDDERAPVEQALPKPAPPAEPSRGLHRAYFWTGVGVTAALTVATAVSGALALSKSSQFKDQSTPMAELASLRDSGEAVRTASNITLGIGAAAAAATAVLYFFTDFDSPREVPRVSADVRRSGASVLLGASF